MRVIESLHGPYQAQIALLDEVGQFEPMVLVAPGDCHNEPQVRCCEFRRR